MQDALGQLFDEYQSGGAVAILYETSLYVGRMAA